MPCVAKNDESSPLRVLIMMPLPCIIMTPMTLSAPKSAMAPMLSRVVSEGSEIRM